jgi:hypothetical protein
MVEQYGVLTEIFVNLIGEPTLLPAEIILYVSGILLVMFIFAHLIRLMNNLMSY